MNNMFRPKPPMMPGRARKILPNVRRPIDPQQSLIQNILQHFQTFGNVHPYHPTGQGHGIPQQPVGFEGQPYAQPHTVYPGAPVQQGTYHPVGRGGLRGQPMGGTDYQGTPDWQKFLADLAAAQQQAGAGYGPMGPHGGYANQTRM